MGLCRSLAGASFHYTDRREQRSSDLSFGEYRREIFPLVEIRRRQIVRLAFEDRAQGALLVDAQVRRRRRAFRLRLAFKRAIALEPDRESGLGVLALDAAIGLLPAALDLGLE